MCVRLLGEVFQRLAPDLTTTCREDALTKAGVQTLAASLEVDGLCCFEPVRLKTQKGERIYNLV